MEVKVDVTHPLNCEFEALPLPALPPARTGHAMAVDDSGRALLYGGCSRDNVRSD